MLKKLFIIFFIILISPVARAEERGFSGKTDFHIGPVFKIGIPLYTIPCTATDPTCTQDSNIEYNNSLDLQFHQLSFWGENLLYGSSLITIKHRPISQTIDLNALQPNLPPGTKENLISLTRRFIEIGICSPIYYEKKEKVELGWQGELIYQKVEFSEKYPFNKEFNSNIGGSIGAYGKIYHLYPYVPYVKGSVLLGNFLDMSKFFASRTSPPTSNSTAQAGFTTSFKTGYSLDAGIDIYIFHHLIVGVSYSLWQLDIDQTQFLNIQGGFLF